MGDSLLKITIDTNVIVSALLFGGNSKIIIEHLTKRKFIAFTSPQLVSELVEVLVQKFGFDDVAVKKLQIQIANLFKVVYPLDEIDVVRDRDDNRVLEVAVESDSSLIVTGDKDLLDLGNYKNIKIVSPKGFVYKYL